MKLRHGLSRWDQFLFKPISSLNIAFFRIIWGIIALANILMMWPDRHSWFGKDSILGDVTGPTIGRLNIMSSFIDSRLSVDLWFIVLIVVLLFVTAGLFTRLALFTVWLMLTSMHHTNTLILHSGDSLLRITGFFLIFSASHTCLSLDAKRHRCPASLHSPWAQRIIQIQLCIVYFSTAWWKLKGAAWNDGTAVGTVLNLLEFQRLPLPDFMRGTSISPLLTGFALTVEMLFPLLIWFRDTRKLALIAGLLLHIGMEWSMNVQLFQWITASMYLLFISPETIRQFLALFARRKYVTA